MSAASVLEMSDAAKASALAVLAEAGVDVVMDVDLGGVDDAGLALLVTLVWGEGAGRSCVGCNCKSTVPVWVDVRAPGERTSALKLP